MATERLTPPGGSREFEPLSNQIPGEALFEQLQASSLLDGEVMLVGHQPQIGEMVSALTRQTPDFSPGTLIAVIGIGAGTLGALALSRAIAALVYGIVMMVLGRRLPDTWLAEAVLVFEPSLDGALKTARKGTSWYGLDIAGRAALHTHLLDRRARHALPGHPPAEAFIERHAIDQNQRPARSRCRQPAHRHAMRCRV